MKVKDFLPLIKEDNSEGIQKLIAEKEFDVNSKDEIGYTVLMYAVVYHRSEIIDILLQKGANPFLVSELGSTALSLAFKESETSLAKKFLQPIKSKLDKSPVSKYLGEDNDKENGAFCCSVASDISKENSQLKEILGLDASRVCFIEAVQEAEALGQDVSGLSSDF